MARTAHIVRQTSESSIDLELNLDGTGKTNIETTVPFYNHMMTALGKHSLIDLNIVASGDTDIDAHHTVEDTAIVFGEALRQALGDKRGIRRFGDILREASAGLCFVGRNGGNKFMALFEDCDDEKLNAFLTRVQQSVEKHDSKQTTKNDSRVHG